MNALTLHQPWASLVAVGAKSIETRSWRAPARAIGQPLAIHAGKQRPVESIDGEQGLRRYGDWWVEDTRLGTFTMHHDIEDAPDVALPLGAVVASATLIDCVPMVESSDRDTIDSLVACVELHPRASGREAVLWVEDADEDPVDLAAQLPFGDFSPGRFAWLLGDVKPTTERCPWCWESEATKFSWCPVCEGRGSCDPVPAKGRQGLWTWTV